MNSRNFKRVCALTALSLAPLCFRSAFTQPSAAPPPQPWSCDSTDPAFVCGLHDPEDIVRLPGTRWVVASSLNIDWGSNPHKVRGPGPLSAINVDTRAVETLYPTPQSKADWDRTLYPDCKAPPTLMMSIGLNAISLGAGWSRLYVPSHGERESVEIIGVDTRGEGPQATWRGCVRVPKALEVWPNAVVPLPDEGIALAGNNVALWHPGRGWKRIDRFKGVMPGEKPGKGEGFANGVEVSRDQRWLFVADTLKNSVTRFPLKGHGSVDVLTFDQFSPGYFWPDNLRYGEDGALYLSGPYRLAAPELLSPDCYFRVICDEMGTGIVRIDPNTFTAQVIYKSEGIAGKFGAATTALELGSEFWVATSVGNRLAVIPRPANIPVGH